MKLIALQNSEIIIPKMIINKETKTQMSIQNKSQTLFPNFNQIHSIVKNSQKIKRKPNLELEKVIQHLEHIVAELHQYLTILECL